MTSVLSYLKKYSCFCSVLTWDGQVSSWLPLYAGNLQSDLHRVSNVYLTAQRDRVCFGRSRNGGRVGDLWARTFSEQFLVVACVFFTQRERERPHSHVDHQENMWFRFQVAVATSTHGTTGVRWMYTCRAFVKHTNQAGQANPWPLASAFIHTVLQVPRTFAAPGPRPAGGI